MGEQLVRTKDGWVPESSTFEYRFQEFMRAEAVKLCEQCGFLLDKLSEEDQERWIEQVASQMASFLMTRGTI